MVRNSYAGLEQVNLALMNILLGLAGISGEIAVNGQVVKLDSPSTASLGIGMVHQHFMLVRLYCCRGMLESEVL